MSRGFERRVRTLESVGGVNSRLFVYRLRFHPSVCDDDMPYSEFRFLSDRDNKARGRQLAPGELLPGVEGGEVPWDTNPDFVVDSAERERIKLEA